MRRLKLPLRSLPSLPSLPSLREAVWLVPLAALLIVYRSPHHVVSPARAAAALIAGAVIVIAARRPDRCVMGLIILLPFQGLLLAKLWGLGASAGLVKELGFWKEALGIAIVLAGARNFIASGRHADTLDRIALAFVAFTVLYLALGREIVPSSPASLSVRALGFRETGGFVLLLLGARHAPMPSGFGRRVGRVVIAVGVVVAGCAIYEAINPDGWNRFAVGTMEYTRYEIAVLGTTPLNMWNILTYGQIGGSQVVRSGSVFLNALTCGFYLLIPFAVAFERTLRRGRSWSSLAPTLIIGAGLVLTETRSAIIGALLVAILGFQPAAGRQRHHRTQVALVLGVLALLVLPAAVASGALSRFSLLNDSHDTSTHGHEQSLGNGLRTVVRHPLGLGLGTAAGTGQRFQVQDTTIAEDNYLEFGDELGAVPMLVFIALTLILIGQLHRTARARGDPVLTATWTAAAGLAVSAIFLQTWSDFSVSWTFWCLAGAMLGTAGRRVASPPSRASPTHPVRPPVRSASLVPDLGDGA